MSALTTTAAPRYACYGRVSTEDEQDPTLSFPRQLGNAERLVADSGGRIVAHYYDIGIPRDGWLQDLLAEAARRPARFDRVIVESISRLSRNSSVAFRVEDELRTVAIRPCAADEPLEQSFGTIVLRHVNVGIARGYHRELMVKSRQGLETSTKQGWHTGGVALYGYQFATHDHPNPHQAARGQAKRTLQLDPVRAPVVRAIYDMYLAGGVGITQIRDRLNAEPDRYPPPIPGRPGPFGRRLEPLQFVGGAAEPAMHRLPSLEPSRPEKWQQPDQPARDLDLIRGARTPRHRQPRRAPDRPVTCARQRAFPASSPHRADTAGSPDRIPLPRSAALRNLRAPDVGNQRKSTYYSCQPSHQRSKNIPADHPPTVYLNEKRLNDALFQFLATALFGPDRLTYWTRALDDADDPEHTAPVAARLAEVQAEIADLERRLNRQLLHRQLLNLEADDTTVALRKRIGARVANSKTPSPTASRAPVNSPSKPRPKHPRWPTSPRYSTAYPSSPDSSPICPNRNYAPASTPCNSKSPTSPRTRLSTSHSRCATTSTTRPPNTKRRRTGPCPRQDSTCAPASGGQWLRPA